MAQALYAYLVRYPDYTVDTVLTDLDTAVLLKAEIVDTENTYMHLLSEIPAFTLNQAKLFAQEV